MNTIAVLSKDLNLKDDAELKFINIDSVEKLKELEGIDLYLIDIESFSNEELSSLKKHFEKTFTPLILVSKIIKEAFEIFSKANVYSFINSKDEYELLTIIKIASKGIQKSETLNKFLVKLSELKENLMLSSMSVILQDTSHKVIWVNKFAADLLDLTPDDLKGRYCYEIWHKRESPCEGCPISKTIETKKFEEGQSFSETTNKWWHLRSYPVLDENGNLVGVIEVSQDINESKKIEEDLKEKEDILKLISENTNDIIYVYRIKPYFFFEYVSSSVERILGYSPEEHYNDPELGLKIIHPDDRNLLLEYFNHGRKFDTPLVLRFVKKNGEILWVEQINRAIYNEDGEVIKLIGVARDITIRKVYEKEIIRKERFLSNLLSNLPGIVYMGKNDKERTMNYVSEGAVNILGISTSDKIFSFSEYINPEDKEMVYSEIQKAIDERRPYEIRYRIFCKEKERWILEKGVPVFNNDEFLFL